MAKIKTKIGNTLCPQALFLYGNWKEDGTPNFGLFCWLSYTWTRTADGDGMGIMACIGGEKLTKDLIRKTGVFSANLVSEKLLPLADYYGNTSGRAVQDKMKRLPTVERGQVLDVPTIAESPVSFELEVQKEIHLTEDSDVFLCAIRNVTAEEAFLKTDAPFIQRFLAAAPVLAPGEMRYSSADGRDLGAWGEPMKRLE